MRLLEGAAQPLDGHMRVALRGGEVRVAQQFLHRAQIRAALQHMGGGTVPHGVRGDDRDARGIARPHDDRSHHPWINADRLTRIVSRSLVGFVVRRLKVLGRVLI